MTDQKNEEIKKEIEYQALTDFLETTPPNQLIDISDLSKYKLVYNSYDNVMRTPELQLHCDHENCNGIRFFRCVEGGGETLPLKDYKYFYITYRCSNCQETKKIYFLAVKVSKSQKPGGKCYKFGELPAYGPPVASKLIKLIGPDREEFLKGRRCENQGLGVGAFIYYRRVIENQKNRIIGETLKVAEKIGATEDKLEILRASIKEKQFSKALGMAKDAIPESLLINGYSPILLLHNALSDGIHSKSDDECLESATSVRIVLGELSERLSQALKDEVELTKALSKLMNKSKT